MSPLIKSLVDFQRHLDAGVMKALKYLNSRVAHRFTAIYKVGVSEQRAVYIYDMQGDPPSDLYVLPSKDCLTQFITPSKPFSVTDSTHHELLENYRYRESIASYYGISISHAAGVPIGILCHFDYVPREALSIDERLFLNSAKNQLLNRLNGF